MAARGQLWQLQSCSPGRKKNPSQPGQEAVAVVKDSTRDTKACSECQQREAIAPKSGPERRDQSARGWRLEWP